MSFLVSARIAPVADDNRTAVRNAIPIVDSDGIWWESYASDSFLALDPAKPPAVRDRHDGRQIGYVSTIAAGKQWVEADLIVDEDAGELLEVGAAVSIDARSIRRDDHQDARTRRHRLVQLTDVCLVAPGEVAGLPGAKITAIRPLQSSLRSEDLTPSGEEIIHGGGTLVRTFATKITVR